MAGKQGGARPGAGRPRGSKSRTTIRHGDGKSIVELAREAAPRLIPILLEIAEDRDSPAAARVTAINTIWDRAHGKALQTMEHTGKDGAPLFSFLSSLASDDDDQPLHASGHGNGANGSAPH